MVLAVLLLLTMSLITTISTDNTRNWYQAMATERQLLFQQMDQHRWDKLKNCEQNGLTALSNLQKSNAFNSLKETGIINPLTLKIMPLALQLGLIRISRLILSLPLWLLLITLAIIEGQRRRAERRLLGERESVTRYRYATHLSHGVLMIGITTTVILPLPLSTSITLLMRLPFLICVGLAAGAFALTIRYRIACYKKYT